MPHLVPRSASDDRLMMLSRRRISRPRRRVMEERVVRLPLWQTVARVDDPGMALQCQCLHVVLRVHRRGDRVGAAVAGRAVHVAVADASRGNSVSGCSNEKPAR